MFLLDTNVVSELRRRRPHGAVVAWLASVPSNSIHIPAVTIGEIQYGIEITKRQDAQKAAELSEWLSAIIAAHVVVPMDSQAFRVWVGLKYRVSNTVIEDAMIAATAIVHDLTVVTRDVADFSQFGVRLLNPFEYPCSSSS